jgi:large subunit ribosomal protein L9
MKVILKETIDSLGIIGSEVSVADGYARNYLLPQNKAVTATPQNRKMLEQESAKFELQIAKERKLAEEMAQRLEGVVCTIAAKVSEDDRLYGSVSVRDIVDTLANQDIVVEKRMVLLKEPIKAIGSYFS